MSEPIQVCDSTGAAYHRAFQVFLDHTDQKDNARRWLDRFVQALPEKRVFIDAGAGNGKVTAWYAGSFARTIAVEPNDSLRRELAQVCPRAELSGANIEDASPAAAGDFILCSHVLYYIDGGKWQAVLERLASWLSPRGSLVVVLQNHGTQCMKMLEHFLGRSFNLALLARQFQAQHPDGWEVKLDSDPARIATRDFAAAYTIAEFMLNLLPLGAERPTRPAVEDYIRRHFATADGGFRFSNDQDFLQIRRQQ